MPNQFILINEETREVLRLDATDRRDVLSEILQRFGFKLEKTQGNQVGSCCLCTGKFRLDLPHYARGMCKHCYQVGQHRKRANMSEVAGKCQTCEFGLRRDCQLTKIGVCIKEKTDV